MIKKIRKIDIKGILKNNSGLTLVELIIALAISVIVVAAAGFILLTQSGVIRFNRSVSTEQQRLNTAFNTVRYSLRMAGFDEGQSVFIDNSNTILPVLIIQPQTYNGTVYPYEVEISYFQPPANGANINGAGGCTISNRTGTNFSLSPSCNINNFQVGDILSLSNDVPPVKQLCITHIDTVNNTLQFNHGVDNSCDQMNPTPPGLPSSANISISLQPSQTTQALFYWGNGYKAVNGACPNGGQLESFSDGKWCTYNFNYPFDKPGHLYKCLVQSPPSLNAPPVCSPNTIVTLSDYIYNFEVTASGSYNQKFSFPANLPYSVQYNYIYNTYILSITSESSVALSDSPAYSINVPYNANINGANAVGNAGQVVGNNVLKTLNSNVFLRNVFYGS